MPNDYLKFRYLDLWRQRSEPIPKNLNNELLLDKPNLILKYDPVDSHMWNYVIDPNLQEGVDYEIIDEAMWNHVSKYNVMI